MEELIKDYGLGTFLLAIITWSLKLMHKQAMEKLDTLIDSNNQMGKNLAVHAEKLNNGKIEFEKISLHQKEQDIKIAANDKRITILENTE